MEDDLRRTLSEPDLEVAEGIVKCIELADALIEADALKPEEKKEFGVEMEEHDDDDDAAGGVEEGVVCEAQAVPQDGPRQHGRLAAG